MMQPKSRRWYSLGIGAAIIMGILLARGPLTRWTGTQALLANPAPPPELVEESIADSPDHEAAILAAWNTGRIIQREAAVRALQHDKALQRNFSPRLETLVQTGALDADSDVREICLGILRERNDPALAALAIAQLHDCDPQLCLLGLNYLKDAGPATGVPVVIPLLDNQNPEVAAAALKLIEKWSGEKFGVKMSDTVPEEDKNKGLIKYPDGISGKVRLAAAKAKTWYAKHAVEFPPVQLKLPQAALAEHIPEVPEDFSLRDLNDQVIKLSNFRGKVVLINFWTTWCTACVSEIPELIELQKSHEKNLVIIGICLDATPTDDGDTDTNIPPNVTRAKVMRAIQTHGINYPVLLDDHFDVGGRFNGGELPTTVILDATGQVRRRFIGARDLSVFETMIAEASQPRGTQSTGLVQR